MSRKANLLIAGVTLLMMLPATGVHADVSLFLLHHSTGRYFIEEGNVRQTISDLTSDRDTEYNFWDHDYTYIGLMDPSGSLVGHSYGSDLADTDPIGLHHLWTTSNAARDSILNNHQVIAFKSCYPACHIGSDAILDQYKTWYNEMGEVFDQYPHKIFVIVSPPPLHRLRTNVGESDRAREFANWLGGAFLSGHANLRYFDLFDTLAQADDGSATRNMLRYEFEKSHSNDDSHPNSAGNLLAGPAFATVMVDAGYVPNKKTTLDGIKAIFR